MRLDKYIASVTDLSRKQVRMAIRSLEVSVNGNCQQNPSQHISEHCEVMLADQLLPRPGPRYLMLHKPVGVVCANRDSHQTTVIDLLDLPRASALQIVGRLDIDTTGLVLLTDDGQWNHRLTSPRHDCHKLYELTTAEPLAVELVARFERGVMLQPENQRTRPARLQILDSHRARLTISEGRYHQVKRMFGAVGNRVIELHRRAIGKIELDQTLQAGSYRELTRAEIESVSR